LTLDAKWRCRQADDRNSSPISSTCCCACNGTDVDSADFGHSPQGSASEGPSRRYGMGGECWATGYQGSIGALSTAWPCSICPPLAVPWRVCLEYFDGAKGERDQQVRQHGQQQYLGASTKVPEPYGSKKRVIAASSSWPFHVHCLSTSIMTGLKLVTDR